MFLGKVTADPLSVLWHFATGHLPDFMNKQSGQVGWVRWSHRGVQYLDKFAIPRKQRASILSDRFELRFNHAFEQVVRSCADPGRPGIQKRAGATWMTAELISALLSLRRTGFAHSFEAWEGDLLAGGIWGVQIGGLVTMSSMFSRVSNAGRFAMGRTMMRLKERGFRMVDMGMVPDHRVHFGAEWVPRWKYEQMLPGLIRERVSIDEANPCPNLPWAIRLGEPVVRVARKVRRRVLGSEARYGIDRNEMERAVSQVSASEPSGLNPI